MSNIMRLLPLKLKLPLNNVFKTMVVQLLISSFFTLLALTSVAQNSTEKNSTTNVDTTDISIVSIIKASAATEMDKSIQKLKDVRNAIRQDEILAQLKKESFNLEKFTKKGIDTNSINADFQKLSDIKLRISKSLLADSTRTPTQRDLSTSLKLFYDLSEKAQVRKKLLETHYKKLVQFRNVTDSLSSDSALFEIPFDSAKVMQYLIKMSLLSIEVAPVDSTLDAALPRVQTLLMRFNFLIFSILSEIEEINELQRDLATKTFSKELPYLWNSESGELPIKEIIDLSWYKGKLAFSFYIKNNLGKFFILALLFLISAIFLYSIKSNLKKDGLLKKDYTGQLVIRHPVLSSLLIVISIFQFIFPAPPFVFNLVLWVISAASLSFIYWNFITKFWMQFWLTMILLFLFASADNLILVESHKERIFILILALIGLVAALVFLLKGDRKKLKEKWIVYFIGFVIILEAASIITNIFGRYNLSKTLMTSGFFNVIIAIIFLWTVRLINEGLALASEIYKSPDKKLFYLNFDRVGNKVPGFFYALVIVGWFILFGRNFYAFKYITDPIKDLLFEERVIGNYIFDVKSVLVFFMILILSSYISKIVSFFASDEHHRSDKKRNKSGVGSWLLIIRITIFSLGLFLAFAAAGIPLDKITIILGALGVGIGFGLQTLVNNLVSGLLISFEKPVNIGDIVEIGGRSGVMKSIGFRSSIITTGDGADVIIPNGDLLNQHLVNWTLNNSKRRVNLLVGVAYGTDLENCRKLLLEIFEKDKRISKFPKPSVIASEFNASSIDLQLYFWVGDITVWSAVRSDIIVAIDVAFKDQGIVIPFPQQDLYIHKTENDKK